MRRTSNLDRFQQHMYKVMRAHTDKPFFLRLDSDDHALWACDLPRRTQVLETVKNALGELSVVCIVDEKNRLWHMDWTKERYDRVLGGLPGTAPPLPEDDALHTTYALCRLLLCHPAPLGVQPCEALRRVLKLCAGNRAQLIKAVPQIHAESAERLRRGLPLANAAGRVLAGWLSEQANVQNEEKEV